QAPSSRNDNRVSHSERSGGISTSVAGAKRSLHSGRKLPPVEMTDFACRFRSQAPSSRNDNRVSHSERSRGISRTAAPSQNRLFCLYRTVTHVVPTGARGAQWRNLDACGWWQEISPFRSQAPSSRNDNRVSHCERSRGISTPVAGGKRSLHSGRKLPPVEIRGIPCRFRSQGP